MDENYRLRAEFGENKLENVQMKEGVIGVALKKGARELYVSGQIGQVGLLTPSNWITIIITTIIVVIVDIMSPPNMGSPFLKCVISIWALPKYL